MPGIVISGSQWGDEGKGKIVDYLLEKNPDMRVVFRYNGGHNSGHTVVINGQKYVLHMAPSGLLHAHIKNVVGNGCVVEPYNLVGELTGLQRGGVSIGRENMFISDRAHVIMPYHLEYEKYLEEHFGIGTTKRGIGPAYMTKAERTGIRIGELDSADIPEVRDEILKKIEFHINRLKSMTGYEANPEEMLQYIMKGFGPLKPFVNDTSLLVNEWLEQGLGTLFEGAQAGGLDIDHGTYPYVTSSNATMGGVFSGSGVRRRHIDRSLGIAKAYTTRVGGGPFPTEISGDLADLIRERGDEFGASTGRPRKVGWFDGVVTRDVSRLNDTDELVVTKTDVLRGIKRLKLCDSYDVEGQLLESMPSLTYDLERAVPNYKEMEGFDEDISRARRWHQLPVAVRNYLERIEDITGVHVGIVSVGPDREQTISC